MTRLLPLLTRSRSFPHFSPRFQNSIVGISQQHSQWTIWLLYPNISKFCWISFLASRSLHLLLWIWIRLLPSFSPLCHMRRWFCWCIVPVPLFHQFVRVIGPMDLILKLTGPQRSFILLSAAVGSVTTNTSFRPALTDNGLMEGSSRYPWVHLQQSQKLLGVEILTANNHSTLALSTLILPLVTASWWAAFGTPWCLLTKPLITTGFLVSRICRVPQFLQLSVSFVQMPVHMLGVPSAIVMPNFLGQRFGNILLTMPPTSLLRQRVASCLMASWSCTGRLWSTWPVHT